MKKTLLGLIILIGIKSFGQSSDSTKLKDSTANAIISSQKISEKINSLDTIQSHIDKLYKDLETSTTSKKKIEAEINDLNKKRTEFLNELKNLKDSLDKKIIPLIESLNIRTSELAVKEKNLKDKIDKLKVDSTKLSKDTAQLKKDLQEKTQEAVTKLKALTDEVLKREDSTEIIAKFRMRTFAVVFKDTSLKNSDVSNMKNLFDVTKVKDKSKQKDTIEVQSIRLRGREGLINEIIVTLVDSSVFRNFYSPVDLVHFGNRLGDILYLEESNDTVNIDKRDHIFLGNVLAYSPLSYNDVAYTSFDILLTQANKEYQLKESTSINTYFDVAAYTDMKGISGEANGLAQLAASAKFILNTKNIRGKASIPFNYVSLVGGISKFDNSFKGTFINKNDSANRKDLFQRSQYFIGVKLNLLHWVISPYPRRLIQDMQLNVGYNFLGANIADTLSKKGDTLYRSIVHNQLYIEPTLSFNRRKNFSLTLSLPFFYQSIKASAGIKNSANEWWACPSINLMYYSKRSQSNKLFFRYSYFVNLEHSENAFIQAQLGYSASINDFMKK
ncbi:MAG: hypothetical protein QM541_05220 [Flavobacterium sp.]|nr:hypothetical protein [Flavobacterium sp.]